MITDVVKASKFLSLVLRHKPEEIRITLDSQGWVDVSVLLAALAGKMDEAMVRRAVAENNKQRFEFSPDGLRIRARQGHSVNVELGLDPEEPPSWLYHGTSINTIPLIRAGGIRKMARHAVHLSATVAVAQNVGERHGKPAILVVASGAMAANTDAKFYKSANGVWLTDYVPVEYILFPCSICHQQVYSNVSFMVHDALWASAGMPPNEVLHAKCLEQKLGRPLVEADFKDVPLNYHNGYIKVRP